MKEFMPGKLYKALCSACTKPKQNRPRFEKPWYSPKRHAVVATNTYVLVELDYETTEQAPCVCGGDPTRVLAKDLIAFDLPLEREPVNASGFASLLDEPTEASGNIYDCAYLETLVKIAKAGGWFIIFDNKPGEIIRGRFFSEEEDFEVGRFVVMPKCGNK